MSNKNPRKLRGAAMGARRNYRTIPDKSVLQDGIYVNERFLHTFASCIGCVVQVTVKNGKVYEGILRTTSPKVEIVLERAHAIDESSDASSAVISSDTVIKTLIFQKTDIVMMTVADVNLDYAIIDGYADTSASKCNGLIREKELEPWVGDGAANEDGLEAIDDSVVDGFDRNETGWDANEMFNTNAEKFNIKSDYDPNLTQYTTPLQKSDTAEYRQREAHAQKLAMEIERGTDYARRSALENSEENGDDEEMAFSAVHRPGSASSQSTGKYVVPHLRNSVTVSPAPRPQQPTSSGLPTTAAAATAVTSTASPQPDTVTVTPSSESSVRVNGTEETRKSSPSLAAHDIAESHAPRKDLPTPSQPLVRPVPHKQEQLIAGLKEFSNNFKLSESDGQDRRSGGAVAVSAAASSASQSQVSSMTEVPQTQSTTPQPVLPTQLVMSTQSGLPPQPGMETADSKGTSPAPENSESADVAKKSSLNPLAKEFNPSAKPMRVIPASTPPRPVSVPLSPSSNYPPMPGGQVVYPSPQPPPSFVSVPQSQSSQRLSGPQNKRVTVSARGATNDGNAATPQSAIMNGAPLMTPPVVPVAYPQQSIIPVGPTAFHPQLAQVRLIVPMPQTHELTPANQMPQMVSSSQPGMYLPQVVHITPHGGVVPPMPSHSQSGQQQQQQQTPQQPTSSGHQTPTPSQHTPYGPGVGVMPSAAGTPPQTHLYHAVTQHPVIAPQGPAPPSPQVNYTSGPMPLHYASHQGLMTLVPTPQPAQQPIGGTPSQSGGPAGAAQHHMIIPHAGAQQHSLHTGVPPQMIIPSQPQPGIQAPPVGAHQYVQAHPIPGNVPPGHASMAAPHVINMQTNMTPAMYVQHHAVHPGPQGQPYQHSAAQ